MCTNTMYYDLEQRFTTLRKRLVYNVCFRSCGLLMNISENAVLFRKAFTARRTLPSPPGNNFYTFTKGLDELQLCKSVKKVSEKC